jgi:hypothetical protein
MRANFPNIMTFFDNNQGRDAGEFPQHNSRIPKEMTFFLTIIKVGMRANFPNISSGQKTEISLFLREIWKIPLNSHECEKGGFVLNQTSKIRSHAIHHVIENKKERREKKEESTERRRDIIKKCKSRDRTLVPRPTAFFLYHYTTTFV